MHGNVLTPADWRKQIVNPQRGTNVVRDRGRAEFHGFVTRTWENLVLRESREYGSKPSISVFCRMDIGLRIEHGHNPEYFVNEVERTPTTSLWLTCNHTDTLGTLADTFAMVFKQWVMDMVNPYIIA